MPKDLRWKIVLIVLVMLFASVAVYPPQDSRMWWGKVRDKVNSRGDVVERELLVSLQLEQTGEKPDDVAAALADKASLSREKADELVDSAPALLPKAYTSEEAAAIREAVAEAGGEVSKQRSVLRLDAAGEKPEDVAAALVDKASLSPEKADELVESAPALLPKAYTSEESAAIREAVGKAGGRMSRQKTFQVEDWLAYVADKLTLGIFHHKKESYSDEEVVATGQDARTRAPYKRIERTVEVYAAGLTLGLDLEGGAELRYYIQQHGDAAKSEATAKKVIEIIRRRIDAMGLKEPVIQPEGTDRLQIQLPGKDEQEIERIKNIIESTGHLEFRIVADDDTLLKQARAGDIPEGYRFYEMRNSPEQRLLISDKIALTGEYIISTDIQYSDRDRQLEVTLDFNGQGRRLFSDVTSKNIGKQLAIILDDIRDAEGNITKQGTLYSAPAIRQAIFGSASISGEFTRQQAEDLRTTLQAGSLPATLELEDENWVGPSLGKDSIDAGKLAIIIGFFCVILFMLIYYHKAGIIASLALILNLVLIVGALAIFQATLTLPGIAGILLTVGMAVDANVLIFERIREEMQKKGTDHLLMAVRDGYSRALVTIVDANLTTLGTALILYMIGTGTVKGFAATLSLGIIFSMFTAIFVTRVIFELFITKGWIKSIGMFRIIGESSYPFSTWARYTALVSAGLIALGMVAFGVRGTENYDIDFRGGTMLHIVTKPDVTDHDVRSLVAPDYPDAVVQSIVVTGDADRFREYSIKTSARGESRITKAEMVSTTVEDERMRPYIGGYELQVETDRPQTIQAVKDMLSRRGQNEAAVYGLNSQGSIAGSQNEAFTNFMILTNLSEQVKARQIVRDAFNELGVKADVARLMADKLVPDGFQVVETPEEETLKVLANFKAPVAVADVEKNLGIWGYKSPAVAVKDNPAAAQGITMEMVVTPASGDPDTLRNKLEGQYEMSEPFARVRSVGAHVAGVMKQRALIAVVLSLIFVIGYIWARFELNFGIAAVAALVHDVAFTVGILAVMGVPFNLTIIAAILTIIGYSLNDTIVVFDRIRENLNLLRREKYENIINISINQTLSRTLLTSLTTLIAVLALLVFGGGVIRDFAKALTAGVIVGTYSSIFIASPIVVMLQKRAEKKRHQLSGAPAKARG